MTNPVLGIAAARAGVDDRRVGHADAGTPVITDADMAAYRAAVASPTGMAWLRATNALARAYGEGDLPPSRLRELERHEQRLHGRLFDEHCNRTRSSPPVPQPRDRAAGARHSMPAALRIAPTDVVGPALSWLRELVRDVIHEELALGAGDLRDGSDEYLTIRDAADIACVSQGCIRRWIRNDKLTEHRAGRVLRVRRTELNQLLAAGSRRRPPSKTILSPEEMARRDFG